MAVSQIIDITADINATGNAKNIDIGGWDFAVVQLVAPAGTMSFFTSNDSGDVQGSTDGNATSATNFIVVTGTNLATGSGVTTLAVAGLVKFTGIGRYLRLSGTTATKVLVRLYKSF